MKQLSLLDLKPEKGPSAKLELDWHLYGRHRFEMEKKRFKELYASTPIFWKQVKKRFDLVAAQGASASDSSIWGFFSSIRLFFHQNPLTIAKAVAVAMLLGLIFLVSGSVIVWRKSLPFHVTSAISLCNINNVLVIVFAAEFFGPRELTVAAMYMIPFFSLSSPCGPCSGLMKYPAKES